MGTFNLQSTGNVTETCAFYEPLKKKNWIEGKFFCKGTLVDPGQQGSKPTEQDGSSQTGAATSLSAVNGALGLAAMAAVFLL